MPDSRKLAGSRCTTLINWCHQQWYAASWVEIAHLNCGFVAQMSFWSPLPLE